MLAIFEYSIFKFLQSIVVIYIISVAFYQDRYQLNSKLIDHLYYYALNKILSSDWLNTNLTLDDIN